MLKALSPVPDRQGGQRDAARASPTAPSTSSSAPTGCSAPTSGSRTSGWSSSTRSSASASSTRSSSSSCAPRSTCCRCRPRRSRARWRWRSPASGRCPRSPPRRRSGTRCSPSSARYDDRQVAAAIHRELLRDGQVFYLHNRVESIERAAARIRELVPEARVAVAHGQMGEDPLEQVMVGFWEKEFDVLVCTTIVESGHRHPQRQHADRRAGRPARPVPAAPDPRPGRPRPRAGVRLLPLPAGEAAHRDRARAAGHHRPAHRARRRHVVAMKDLEIRGAGNLLGGEQSGHIADVGFDLYVRMVGEAVAGVQGRGAAGGARGQDRPAGRRAPAARLHRRRAAAPGDVQAARRGAHRRRCSA